MQVASFLSDEFLMIVFIVRFLSDAYFILYIVWFIYIWLLHFYTWSAYADLLLFWY